MFILMAFSKKPDKDATKMNLMRIIKVIFDQKKLKLVFPELITDDVTDKGIKIQNLKMARAVLDIFGMDQLGVVVEMQGAKIVDLQGDVLALQDDMTKVDAKADLALNLLANKADKSELANKADKSEVQAELAGKADKSEVEAKLKANAAAEEMMIMMICLQVRCFARSVVCVGDSLLLHRALYAIGPAKRAAARPLHERTLPLTL